MTQDHGASPLATGLSSLRDEAAGASSPEASIPCAGMLSCIVCNRRFDSAANHPHFDCVPYEGTLFYSRGHYGSTVFDPFDGTMLEIIVCDACLVARRERTALILPFTTNKRTTWDDFASPGAGTADAQ